MENNTWPLKRLAEAGIRVIDGDRGINYPKKSDFFKEEYCLFLSARSIIKSEPSRISERNDSLFERIAV